MRMFPCLHPRICRPGIGCSGRHAKNLPMRRRGRLKPTVPSHSQVGTKGGSACSRGGGDRCARRWAPRAARRSARSRGRLRDRIRKQGAPRGRRGGTGDLCSAPPHRIRVFSIHRGLFANSGRALQARGGPRCSGRVSGHGGGRGLLHACVDASGTVEGEKRGRGPSAFREIPIPPSSSPIRRRRPAASEPGPASTNT